MTPREFVLLAEGYRARQGRTMEQLAWVVAYLLTPWSDRVITPNELLGKPSGDVAQVESLLGMAPANPEAAYDSVMAKIAARKSDG